MIGLICSFLFHRWLFIDFLLEFWLRLDLVCSMAGVSFLFLLKCLSRRVQYQVLFLEIGCSLRTFLVITRFLQVRG